MRTNKHNAVPLGAIVAAVYDSAEQYSSDAREVSVMATMTVTYMLYRARARSRVLSRPPTRKAPPVPARAEDSS